ncbi:Uncharacterised protein g4713 [Pycnogonum litorale]
MLFFAVQGQKPPCTKLWASCNRISAVIKVAFDTKCAICTAVEAPCTEANDVIGRKIYSSCANVTDHCKRILCIRKATFDVSREHCMAPACFGVNKPCGEYDK